MAVNLRKKYSGKKEVSKKSRPYRYQLDYYHNGKRVREILRFTQNDIVIPVKVN